MEKAKVVNKSNIDSFKSKEKVGEKIDSLWGENSSFHKNPKFESKKIILKLEKNGTEKRKFMLKMESLSPNSYSSNYSLISDLLKEFFNSSSNLK